MTENTQTTTQDDVLINDEIETMPAERSVITVHVVHTVCCMYTSVSIAYVLYLRLNKSGRLSLVRIKDPHWQLIFWC